MEKKYWGEIDSKENTNHATPDITSEIEKAMSECYLAEFEVASTDDSKPGLLTLHSMDPLMLHAIELHKYYYKLMDMLHSPNSNVEARPVKPQMPEIGQRYVNNFSFNNKKIIPISSNCDVEIPDISEPVVKHILLKCVAVMLAHIGFETSYQSVIDVMSDVLDVFLRTFIQKLKVVYDDEEKGDSFDFPNAIEKVLVDIGMNGIAGLHDYYLTRVVKYAFVLQNRCQNLDDKYNSVAASRIEPVETKKEDEVDADTPNVFHVLSCDDKIILGPSLELLNSFEECIQNQGIE